MALLCELLLKEAFLFQAVGVCWLWASLSIELRGAVHNSPARHFSSPRMLRLLVFPAPFSSVHSAQGLFASECGVWNVFGVRVLTTRQLLCPLSLAVLRAIHVGR